jgi:hypothetical protein
MTDTTFAVTYRAAESIRDILTDDKDFHQVPSRIDRHSVPINTNHDENSACPSCSQKIAFRAAETPDLVEMDSPGFTHAA